MRLKELMRKRTKPDIRDGLFISKWSEGSVVVTPCKVNMDTREVFDIVTAPCGGGMGFPDEESVRIGKTEYLVQSVYDPPETRVNNYWYT